MMAMVTAAPTASAAAPTTQALGSVCGGAGVTDGRLVLKEKRLGGRLAEERNS